MKPIQVYLEPTEIKRLKQVALDKGITMSDLIRLYIAIKDNIAKEIIPRPIKTSKDALKAVKPLQEKKKVEPITYKPTSNWGA